MEYEITVKMDLSNIIEEAREVSRELCEFADKLEQIEKRHKESQEGEEKE